MAPPLPVTPPKIQPRLIGAPKVRQFFWCDFPQDAQLPEFWKRRPVIILSYRNTLHGTVTIIPCSPQAHAGNQWPLPLQTTIDGRPGLGHLRQDRHSRREPAPSAEDRHRPNAPK